MTRSRTDRQKCARFCYFCALVVRVGTADLSAESHQGGSRDAENACTAKKGGAGPLFPLRPQESSHPESQRLRTERQTGKESRLLRRARLPEQREGGGKHQHLTNRQRDLCTAPATEDSNIRGHSARTEAIITRKGRHRSRVPAQSGQHR